ncbi:MAG: FHA domain-containing protein [Syntrophobacterales bacterium]|jgi:pSer/pThr/pTyr-binding forkhead associated (FHA) protein
MIKSCFILESGSTEKRVFPFYQRLTIGRHSANDVALADRMVSKQHAVVGRVKGRIVVKDLGSRNGTFVNGEKVEKAILASGDRLKVGSAVLRFFKEEESSKKDLDGSTSTSRGVQKLGEYLIEAGIVDEFTLLRVLGEEEKSQTIDQMLLDTGVLDDLNIAKSLARQLKMPFLRLKDVEIPQEVTSLVPVGVAKAHLLMPVKVSEGKLVVAMANPLDLEAIQAIRLVARMQIEVAVAPREDILEAFVRAYPVEFLDQVLEGAPDDDEVTIDL